MTREEIYNNIKENLGSVPGFISKLDDANLGPTWETMKKMFLSETSLGLKVNALAALGVAYGLEWEHWIEFHTQTASLAGASEENIEEIKKMPEFISMFKQFLYEINYDFDKFKEEATEIHQFMASKMGG